MDTKNSSQLEDDLIGIVFNKIKLPEIKFIDPNYRPNILVENKKDQSFTSLEVTTENVGSSIDLDRVFAPLSIDKPNSISYEHDDITFETKISKDASNLVSLNKKSALNISETCQSEESNNNCINADLCLTDHINMDENNEKSDSLNAHISIGNNTKLSFTPLENKEDLIRKDVGQVSNFREIINHFSQSSHVYKEHTIPTLTDRKTTDQSVIYHNKHTQLSTLPHSLSKDTELYTIQRGQQSVLQLVKKIEGANKPFNNQFNNNKNKKIEHRQNETDNDDNLINIHNPYHPSAPLCQTYWGIGGDLKNSLNGMKPKMRTSNQNDSILKSKECNQMGMRNIRDFYGVWGSLNQ